MNRRFHVISRRWTPLWLILLLLALCLGSTRATPLWVDTVPEEEAWVDTTLEIALPASLPLESHAEIDYSFLRTFTSAFNDIVLIDRSIILPPEKKKALDEFLDKVREPRAKLIEARLTKKLEEMSKALTLDEAQQDRLKRWREEATTVDYDRWRDAAREAYSSYLYSNEEALASMATWQPEQFASNDYSGLPERGESDVWATAMDWVLKADQLAKAEEARFQEYLLVEKEVKQIMDGQKDRIRLSVEAIPELALNRLRRTIHLGADREAKLEAVSKQVVDEILNAWASGIEDNVRAFNEENRKQFLQGNSSFGISMEQYSPEDQAAWKEAMETLLTSEEREAIAQVKAAEKKRRTRALAMVFVARVNEQLGLSETQRLRWVELGASALEELPSYYFNPSVRNAGYYSIQLTQLWESFKKVEGLADTLSDKQKARWEALTVMDFQNGSMNWNPPSELTKDAHPENAVAAELLISRVLSAHTEWTTKQWRNQLTGRIEQLADLLSLPEKTVSLLTLAAKGTADEEARRLRANAISNMKGNLRGVAPADLPKRLPQMYFPGVSRRRSQNENENRSLFDQTVDRLLTPEQHQQLDALAAEDEQWRNRALAALVATEMEKYVTLTEEKRDALVKRLNELLIDYGPDLKSYTENWYLSGYQTLLPIAILGEDELGAFMPEAEVKPFVTERLGEASGNLDYIKQRHEQRLKNEEKKKEKGQAPNEEEGAGIFQIEIN